MSSKSLDRWLLVNYAGYPVAPNSLMPDNGLAMLAANLLAHGKQVEILDYATVSEMARFSSREMTKRLTRAWQTAFPANARPVPLTARMRVLLDLRYGEFQRNRLQARLIAGIGQRIAARVRSENIQAIGFKLWNGDGILGSAAIARAVKRACPQVMIFGGGPQVDVFMEHVLEHFDVFDAVAYGEGEETIVHLAQCGGDPRTFSAIPNLLFRQDGRIQRTGLQIVSDLNTLPQPVYDPTVYPAMAGNEKIRIMVVDESRGCENNCAFCIHPTKSNHNQRLKSVSRLLQEIECLARETGSRTFRFAGSCTPYELLNAFAAEVLRHDEQWVYASFAHVRDSATAQFDMIRRSGCVSLFFGIESGSQKVLDGMRKGVQTSAICEAIAQAKAAGIFTVGSLIYPAPFDTAQTRAETLDLLRKCRPNAITLQPAGVVPRTDWFEHPERYGISFTSKQRYLERAMGWKVKLLLPPALWRPLPVKINGTIWKKTFRETTRLAKDLADMDLATAISDDTYLMSLRAGMDVRAFRDDTRLAFMAGDARRAGELAAQINANC